MENLASNERVCAVCTSSVHCCFLDVGGLNVRFIFLHGTIRRLNEFSPWCSALYVKWSRKVALRFTRYNQCGEMFKF